MSRPDVSGDLRWTRVYTSIGRSRQEQTPAGFSRWLEVVTALPRACAGEIEDARLAHGNVRLLDDIDLAAEAERARVAFAFAIGDAIRRWHLAHLGACRQEQARRATKGARNAA